MVGGMEEEGMLESDALIILPRTIHGQIRLGEGKWFEPLSSIIHVQTYACQELGPVGGRNLEVLEDLWVNLVEKVEAWPPSMDKGLDLTDAFFFWTFLVLSLHFTSLSSKAALLMALHK